VHKNLAHEPVVSIAPFMWAVPYVRLYPDFCFVLDNGEGTAVGYIVGTPDNKKFLSRYRTEYLPTLDQVQFPKPSTDVPAKWTGEELPTALLQLLYAPDEALLHAEFPRLLEQYPANLHIDVLPPYQGQGYGRQLITKLLGKLREENISGLHLIMAGDNVGAEAFYEKVGFTRFPTVLDGGKSGELGKEAASENAWLVREV
jgi:GNAT superfamily N-acetyltransferase